MTKTGITYEQFLKEYHVVVCDNGEQFALRNNTVVCHLWILEFVKSNTHTTDDELIKDLSVDFEEVGDRIRFLVEQKCLEYPHENQNKLRITALGRELLAKLHESMVCKA